MVSKSERRRRIERERWERQQQRREAAAARSRRRRHLASRFIVVGVALAVAAGGGLWALQAVGSDKTTVAADPSRAASSAPSSTASPGAATGPCRYVDTGKSAGVDVAAPPADPGDLTGAWTASLTLNGKPVEVQLLAEQAPCTVNSLRYLADQNYFDKTECHRLTTIADLKVLQCGDPTGTGTGGPGYQFGTENLAGATYPAGTVAMARAQDPNTNGSQFFLVYDDSKLPPDYTVFGKISSGLEIIKSVAAAGTANGATSGRPKDKVVLDDLIVTHS